MSSFTELGLDPEQVEIYLEALGVDVSGYDTAELESLALVANLMILQAITEKSTEIEQNLAAYQVQVDKTSGMQETLNNLREYVSSDDSTAADLIQFVTTDVDFMNIDDMYALPIDYTVNLSSGKSYTFETLGDYIEGLENDYVEILNDVGETGLFSILAHERDVAIADGQFDTFSSGSYQIVREASDGEYAEYWFYASKAEFREYLIARVLQEAGYIGDDVPVNLLSFANDTLGVTADNYVYFIDNGWLDLMRYYYGQITIDYDTDAGTVDVAYNGTAALADMGIDFPAYFKSGSFVYNNAPEPLASQETDALLDWIADYLIGWRDIDSTTKIVDDAIDDDSDVDTLLQAAATAIESQSTQTEVALLTVNSGITEWGELNDVWDLVHEYVHDSLKRASDNFL